MVAFTSFVFASLLVSSTWGFPLLSRSYPDGVPALRLPPITHKGLFCSIPFASWMNLCPRTTSTVNSLTTQTPIGTAQGTSDVDGAVRYAVRYGSAERWQQSEVVTTWDFPAGAANASGLPLACPQPNAADSTFSEDCLAMLLYVPDSISSSSGAPTMVWIHGGSFISGSATGPGLDGSALAAATGSVVAVIQYRLGALGFMAPSGETNLAVLDVMTALSFLQKVVPSFGGSASKITLAGQSSGANMIRALLATPSASSMFQSAILQSDPMDYGFLNTTLQETLLSNFVSNIGCSDSDNSCINSLSLDSILTAQGNTITYSANNLPAAGAAEPIRPVVDGELITTTLDSTTPFPSVSKPVLISNVVDEAAVTIYGSFGSPVEYSTYDYVVNLTFGEPRAQRLLANELYVPPPTPADGVQDARPMLQILGTDQVWRCATWTFARNWAANGGQAYVGMYMVGATYPGNEDYSVCTEPGAVCHQDDIEIVFGTVPSPTSAQSALVTEVQARYSAFLHNGNPNTGSYAEWTAATSENVTALELGGSGSYPVGACYLGYWGDYVPYDYQVYDI
ncbi:alpha/beta-hydrolase [Sparassis latifolia]|uniref:Carboxylic ester hydrolase n=1 Tax=Sparassis crispa TaxID=139825 RepID=A0A401GHN8_9APHY|nr:predicted protein [Sparassis crispa]GBE81697.1 predicted protein [Sparassis crispa]